MGPIAAKTAGIQIDMTGEGAFEAIDRAVHAAGCTRLGDVEADMVTVAVDALQPPQIGSGLEASKSAIEVRPCPLCKMFACVLAERTAPCTDLRNQFSSPVMLCRPPMSDFEFPDCTAPHEQLIALALVEGAEREQAKRSRDGRHD